jgi:glycerol uptake facilitator-like aquaporin
MGAISILTLGQRLVGELVGTAMLLATVVGSGIMGERLAGGSVALALLANTLATGAGSSRRFSPLVTFRARTSTLQSRLQKPPMVDCPGLPQIVSEAVATFGLLAVIRGSGRSRPDAVPFAVGAYITAAYWFTASTSFANPAVTLARALTPTFSGIRAADVPGFLAGQAIGATAAVLLFRWLSPETAERA